MCVQAHDGRELNLSELTWVRPDGERVEIKQAAE
jgi:hypothetical protein